MKHLFLVFLSIILLVFTGCNENSNKEEISVDNAKVVNFITGETRNMTAPLSIYGRYNIRVLENQSSYEAFVSGLHGTMEGDEILQTFENTPIDFQKYWVLFFTLNSSVEEVYKYTEEIMYLADNKAQIDEVRLEKKEEAILDEHAVEIKVYKVSKEIENIEIIRDSKGYNVNLKDYDSNGVFSESESMVYLRDYTTIVVNNVYSSELEKLLTLEPEDEGYLGDDEKIEVVIMLSVSGPIFQSHSTSLEYSINSDGTVTFYDDNGQEVSKEIRDEIELEKRWENVIREGEIRTLIRREFLEAFIVKNNLIRTEHIKKALEDGRDSFRIMLTKDEVKIIAENNKESITSIERYDEPITY